MRRVVTKDRAAGCSSFGAAGLISEHLDALSEQQALERAAAVGALAITGAGDRVGLPDRAQLAAFLDLFASREHQEAAVAR